MLFVISFLDVNFPSCCTLGTLTPTQKNTFGSAVCCDVSPMLRCVSCFSAHFFSCNLFKGKSGIKVTTFASGLGKTRGVDCMDKE